MTGTTKNVCMVLSDDVFEPLLSFSKSRVSCICPKIFSSYACFYSCCHRCRSRRRYSIFTSRSTIHTQRIWRRKKKWNHENIHAILNKIYVLRHVFNCLKCTFHLDLVSSTYLHFTIATATKHQMVQICMKNAIQVIRDVSYHHVNRFTENGKISYWLSCYLHGFCFSLRSCIWIIYHKTSKT